MIKTRELTLELNSRRIIGNGGLYGGHKSSKENLLPVNDNSGMELLFPSGIRNYKNSLKPTRIVFTNSLICRVLFSSGLSKIRSSIVETISVYVVNLFGRESKNEGVHGDSFRFLTALRNSRHRVKIFIPRASCGAPLKSADNIIIRIVDKCLHSASKIYFDHLEILSNSVKLNNGELYGIGY